MTTRTMVRYAVVLAAVLLFGAMLVPSMAAGEWTMFQGNDDHTGLASGSAPTSTPSNWSASVGSSGWAGIDVTPVVDSSRVYTVNYQGKVYAHYLNGTQAWMNDDITGGYAFKLSTPVVDTATNTLYVAINNLTGRYGIILRAINTADGTERSNVTILSNETSLQANTPIALATFNGYKYVYFGIWSSSSTFHGRYLCYNVSTPTSMTQKWIYYDPSAGSGYYWAGAAVIGNYVVFGNDASYITSLNAVTGAQADRQYVPTVCGITSTGSYIRSSVSYSSNWVYFTARSGYCLGLNIDTASGEFDTDYHWATYIGYTTSTPAISAEKLYVGSGSFGDNGKLTCMLKSNGTVIWSKTDMNGGVQSSPAIYNDGTYDYIYITTNTADGRAYCYRNDGTNATMMWTYDPPTAKQQYALQGVVISDGKAFFGNDAGWLFCLYT